MEGVRTEELSGSNLHKLSNSSCKERTKNFSHCLLILYQKKIEMSRLPKSLSLEFPTVLLTYYLSVYGVPKIEKEVISFLIITVSIILL